MISSLTPTTICLTKMGARSKRKGADGERDCANFLREHGFDAHRGRQYHGGPDSPDVVGIPGYHIEVKRTEAFRLYPALEQAQEDAGEGETPVVFHRKNGKRWVVVMDAESFIDMIIRESRK